MNDRDRARRSRRGAAILALSAALLLGVLAASRPEGGPDRHASRPASRAPHAAPDDPAALLGRATAGIEEAEARFGADSREVATRLGATAQALWGLETYATAL